MALGRSMDLSGDKYKRLTVLKYHGRNGTDNKTMWECRCECGKLKIAKGQYLRNGKVGSCGCLNRDDAIAKLNNINENDLQYKEHGMSSTKLYYVWKAIKQRCNNPNSDRYDNYGGRGIKVCEEWENNFINFYNWSMENNYGFKLTIERIDVNAGYNPNNCEWIPAEQQSRNRTDTIYVKYKGERKPLVEWADITNQTMSKLATRYYRGWSDEEIIGGRHE